MYKKAPGDRTPLKNSPDTFNLEELYTLTTAQVRGAFSEAIFAHPTAVQAASK